MKVVVCRHKCIGSRVCVMTDPQVFEQNKQDGLVRVTVETIASADLDLIMHAVDSCPSSAFRCQIQIPNPVS